MPVAVAGIIIYTILVGASAAVVRAAIMGCLYVILKEQRPYVIR
jgi:predicted membrane metal-binding protein